MSALGLPPYPLLVQTSFMNGPCGAVWPPMMIRGCPLIAAVERASESDMEDKCFSFFLPFLFLSLSRSLAIGMTTELRSSILSFPFHPLIPVHSTGFSQISNGASVLAEVLFSSLGIPTSVAMYRYVIHPCLWASPHPIPPLFNKKGNCDAE